MEIQSVPGKYSVCRLASDAVIPEWIDRNAFYSVTKTADELSVVCRSEAIPSSVKAEHGWGIVKVVGPIKFSTTGVLASLTGPLAEEKISIFALSTYDTDYLMVKDDVMGETLAILASRGIKLK